MDRLQADIIGRAPINPRSLEPLDYSHLELAREVYDVEQPTAAQLSAVRRAAAGLVAEGAIAREPGRAWASDRPGHRRTLVSRQPAGGSWPTTGAGRSTCGR